MRADAGVCDVPMRFGPARLLALLSLTALAVGCGDLQVIPQEGEQLPTEIPVRMTGVHMTSYLPDGSVGQVIEAESVELYQTSQVAHLNGFLLHFYEGQDLVSTLEGDHGLADLQSDDLYAEAEERHIRIARHDKGAILYARRFAYDPLEGELFTDEHFTLVQMLEDGSAQIIQGEEVRADRRLEVIRFSRDLQIRHESHLDLDAFDREIRPLNREADQ
jgi:Lipopolysaccharide-assembly, LptC-related